MRLSNLCEDAKVVLALSLAEKTLESMVEKKEDYEYCRKSVDLCWEWLTDKKISKLQLCERISSNDEKAIADIVMDIEDMDLANKYGTILICVSYVAWQAYNYEEDYYYPQDLETMDDEYLEELINDLIKEKFISHGIYKALLKYLQEHYHEDNKSVVKQECIELVLSHRCIFYLFAGELSVDDIKKAAQEVKVKSTFIPEASDALEIEYCEGIAANWFRMNPEEFQEPENQSFLVEKYIQSIFCISYKPSDLEKIIPHMKRLLTKYGGWIGNDSDGFLPCFNCGTNIWKAFIILSDLALQKENQRKYTSIREIIELYGPKLTEACRTSASESHDRLRAEMERDMRNVENGEVEIAEYYKQSIQTGNWEEEFHWAYAAITCPSEKYLEIFFKILQTVNETYPHWRILDVLVCMPENLHPKITPGIKRAIELNNPSWSEDDLKKAFEALVWIGEEEDIEFIEQCQLRNDRIGKMAEYWVEWLNDDDE